VMLQLNQGPELIETSNSTECYPDSGLEL
jgi:hypothetical protein